MISENLEAKEKNQEIYEDLVVAIEANQGRLALLIAVCDDSNFRDEIITRYETELAPEIRPYRVELAKDEPSLKSAVAELVETEEYLRNSGKTVVTVTGAEKLFFLKLGAEHSEQEKFFGYLQWTREGMREFPFPIVLWVTNQILVNLTKKALDFWGWRKGVFRFLSKKTEAIAVKDIAPVGWFLNKDELSSNDDSFLLPLADLQQLIERIEQDKGTEEPILADLYSRMGEVYLKRLKSGEFLDYQQEQELAISYFRKAIKLDTILERGINLANNWDKLAEFYYYQGKYSDAESLFLQALERRKCLLGEAHTDVSRSLNNLVILYQSQGRYTEAESLCLQALELIKTLLGETHPNFATILNNLAVLYKCQGKYSEAEPLFLQALELRKRLLAESHPDIAYSLGYLALLYYSQGRYSEAEPLFLQTLEIADRTLTPNHPDTIVIRQNLEDLRSKINSSLPKEREL